MPPGNGRPIKPVMEWVDEGGTPDPRPPSDSTPEMQLQPLPAGDRPIRSVMEWVAEAEIPTPAAPIRQTQRELTARDYELKSALPDIEYGLRRQPTKQQVSQERRRLGFGPETREQRERLKRFGQDIGSIEKRSQKLARYSQERDLDKEAKEYERLAKQEDRGFGEAALSGAAWAGEKIDYVTHRPTRVLTSKYLARPGEDPKALVDDSILWTQRLQEEAEKGNSVAQAFTLIPDFLGDVFGAAAGQLVVGAAVTSDLLAGQPTDWRLIGETVKNIKAETRDFFLLMETDWSTYVGNIAGKGKFAVGAGFKGRVGAEVLTGVRGSVARSTMRVARKSFEKGADDPRIFTLLDDIQKIIPVADDPNVMNRIVDTFQSHGLSADDAARAFGKRGEFFGADMPTFLPNEIPFLGAVTRPLTGKVGETIDSMLVKLGDKAGHITDPYVVRKMAQVAYRQGQDASVWLGKVQVPGLNKPAGALFRGYEPVFDLFDPNRRFLKNIRRVAKASATLREDQIIKRFKRIADNAPLDAERRVEISRKAFDPSWKATVDPKTGARIKGGLAKAQTDYHAFLKTLTKSEKRYVDDLTGFFDDIYRESVAAGFLKPSQKAFNPVTGKYFPRLYDNNYGRLVELPDVVKSPWHEEFLPSKMAGREQLMPIADLNTEFIKRAADPIDVVPQYAARIARGEAAVRLENELVAQFGKEMTAEGKSVFGKMKMIDTPNGPMEIPAHAYNFIRGTFDSSFSVMRKFIDEATLGQRGPLTKGLGILLEHGGRLHSRWKRLVLTKRWAYHNLNMLNDGTWMVMDGNLNAGAWVTGASGVLERGKIGIAGVSTLSKKTIKGLEKNVDAIMGTYSPAQTVPQAVKRVSGEVDEVLVPGIAPPSAIPGKTLLASQGVAYRRALKGTLEDKIVFIAKREGLPINLDLSLEKLEAIGPGQRLQMKGELRKIARKGAKSRGEKVPMEPGRAALAGAGHVLENIVPIPGERIARAWEGSSKLGHFMWRLSQGDAPGVAASRTFATLLDYSDPNKAILLTRWFMPFATWVWKSPGAAARLTARSPRSTGAVFKALDVYGAPVPGEPDPAGYVSERGKPIQMGALGKRMLGQAMYDIPKRFQDAVRGAERETLRGKTGDWLVDNIIRHAPLPLVGGTPAQLPGHMGAVMLPREATGEATAFPAEASGLRHMAEHGSYEGPNYEYIAASSAPALKAMYELMSQRSIRTGTKYTGSTGMFSSGFVVPKSDAPFLKEISEVASWAFDQVPRGRAGPDGLNIFSGHVLPFLIGNPQAVAILNSVLFHEAGGVEAGATYPEVGRKGRPYLTPDRAQFARRQQLRNLNLVSGMPFYLTQPGDAMLSGRRRLKRATKASQAAVKGEKERRKRERGR